MAQLSPSLFFMALLNYLCCLSCINILVDYSLENLLTVDIIYMMAVGGTLTFMFWHMYLVLTYCSGNIIVYWYSPDTYIKPLSTSIVQNMDHIIVYQDQYSPKHRSYLCLLIGTSGRHSSQSAFGRLTVNNNSGHCKHHYILFFFSSFIRSVIFFPHRRSAWITKIISEI